VLTFSGYRKTFDAKKMRVIPHPWSHVTDLAQSLPLRWSTKPPARAGFMGTAYADSRAAKLVNRMPEFVQSWFLRGSYLKHMGLVAALNSSGISLRYVNTFPRVRTLEVLSASPLETEIVASQGYSGGETERKRFIDHLQRMTYVVCPRGLENFSVRVYEALAFGRVPVIVDTDMVLPSDIDWDAVSLRVPYQKIDALGEIILADHTKNSAATFMHRQKAALVVAQRLQESDWLLGVFDEIIPS
jgi:hypothetical protein